jgi:NADH-quinone oxidoreductase subunit N
MLRSDERSAESGLKYFVLGSLASGILLYGVSLTYGFTGTTSFDGIRLALGHGLSTGATFGVVFVLAGLAFKISAAPFHMWTPDVYEGAPTPVTTFFATAPKVAALTADAREPGSLRCTAGRLAADRDLRRAALDRDRGAGRHRPDQHQAPDGLFVDQQRRLHAHWSGLRQPAGRRRDAGLSGDLRGDVGGRFRGDPDAADADGEPVEAISDLAGLSKTRPGLPRRWPR